jgi:hypothetical protein
MDARQRLTHLRDPDNRQFDVEASLVLRYILLDTPAQRVFRQLGVLAADFAKELALAIVDPGTNVDVETALHPVAAEYAYV